MTAISANTLTERLCRPQRLGLFGHRGVGKTTLLTMLYREAVAGRLPGLRLAAGDATTANYLADKVLQLESGAILPATLAETELRFQLYYQGTRLELIVKDYQGEQVAVGRQEPIRDFLRDCDAVWLCFDPTLMESRADRLHGEQEAEQVIEDYLKLEKGEGPHRPMAVVLTKADLLPPRPEGLSEELWLTDLTRDAFSMTLHAIKEHAPHNALFAVSSLGKRDSDVPAPRTQNLERPLTWLLEALQAQDEARLDQLFRSAPRKVALLNRAVQTYAHRYPGAAKLPYYENVLSKAKSRRLRVHGLIATAVAALFALGAWTVDSAREKVRENRRIEEARVRESNREMTLTTLRKTADDKDTSTTLARNQLRAFVDEYPETPGLEELRAEIEQKFQSRRLREAQDALNDLTKYEHLLGGMKDGEAARKHIVDLVARADSVITEFNDTPTASEARKLRGGYLRRLDEHDYEWARSYSKREPLNFATRRERYEQYLSRHPQGAFVSPARDSLGEIETEWDKHDFRQVRDHFVKKPAEFDDLIARCERYLAVHDKGTYRDKAKELSAWVSRVNTTREYTVKVIKGDFSKKLGRWYTRGPDLAVEIEVNGIKHGPTPIEKNNYDPKWNYEFPRYVSWKPGDTVKIIVRDHDYWGRSVLTHSSEDDDKLSMKLLSGKFEFDEHAIWFESDFNMPSVPDLD